MRKNKIVLLFDANPLVSQQKSGVGYYTYRLVDQLAKSAPEQVELVGHYFNFLGRKKPDLPTNKNISYKSSWILPGKILSLLRKVGLQLPIEILFKRRGDVALFTNFVSLPSLLPISKITAVHDLCYIDHPEYMQPANQKFLMRFVSKSIKKSNLILTISESTKKSIEKHYPVQNKDILVTPIPPPASTKVGTRPNNLSWTGKYILFVGTLEPRKNFIALARAYALLPTHIKDEYALMLSGSLGWNIDDDMSEIEALRSDGNNIIITGYVSEVEKNYLYKHASLFSLPSHYEGFGMPILEAMSFGIPVVVSDIAVFHEVADNAAVYFNQNDSNDIAKKLLGVLTDDKLQATLKKQGEIVLKEYSWPTVAKDVVSAISKLVNKRKF